MTVVQVSCQGCGAPLDVSEDTRFITCAFCKARLEVLREPTHLETRLLEEVQTATGKLSHRLRIIELQNEIERLDGDWRETCERKYGREQDGSPRQEPDITNFPMMAAAGFVGFFIYSVAEKIWLPLIPAAFLLFLCIKLFLAGSVRLAEHDYYFGQYQMHRRLLTDSIHEMQMDRSTRHGQI